MLVVSDTSPVRALHRIELLDVLPLLFGEVLVPPAVRDELVLAPPGFSPIRTEDHPFLRVVAPNAILPSVAALDLGEREAISLAAEQRADWLLMDERLGRGVALGEGLRTIGVLGILLQAKTVGRLSRIGPELARLRTHGRFRLTDALVQQVLRRAGE